MKQNNFLLRLKLLSILSTIKSQALLIMQRLVPSHFSLNDKTLTLPVQNYPEQANIIYILYMYSKDNNALSSYEEKNENSLVKCIC